MNGAVRKGLRFFFFLFIGIIILWWLYRDQDPEELLAILKKDVAYGWIALSLLLGILSHLSRTIRWQMLIEPVEEKKPGLLNTFLAVMIGYLANLAIPRMGEISRCAVLSRYEKVSFPRLVGTVVTERILDMVMLLISLSIVVLLQYNLFMDVIQNKLNLDTVNEMLSSPWLALIALLIISLPFVFRKHLINSRILTKIKGLWNKFKEGFFSYRRVKNKPLFFLHTILIFVLYFLMVYVCFFGFPFTKDLGPTVGLAVFVMGSFGMVAPVQGGIGPWHFLVITTLLFFGVKSPQAAAFALLVHGSMNALIVITGLLSLLALPVVNKE
ncbi:MAG: lysylphosphatidylglycerol synthase transmembrane domain-containing protein [Marinilabiliaceae bacterium]